MTAKRKANAAGSPMTLAIGKRDSPGVPAEEMHVFVEGTISNGYVAEFHSGILDELVPLAPDWVRTLDTGREKQPGFVGEPVYEAIRSRNFADFGDRDLMPDIDPYLRSFIYESFNRDATIATELGASFTGTGLFEPLFSGCAEIASSRRTDRALRHRGDRRPDRPVP